MARLTLLEALPKVSVSPLDAIDLRGAFKVSLDERVRLAREIERLLNQRDMLTNAQRAQLAELGVTEEQLQQILSDLAGERAGELLGLKPTPTGFVEVPDAPVDITRTTADEVNRLAKVADEDGWSREEWRDALKQSHTLSPKRAEQLADWEFEQADMIAELKAWKAAGVRQVRVRDDNLPASCDVCKKLDGQVISINRAIVKPKEHPNCVRTFEPIWPESK